MSCIVNKVKKLIVGKATSYIIKDNEVIIPVEGERTLKMAYKIAEGKVSAINEAYNAEKFGAVVSINNTYSDGVGINIHPSKILESANEVRIKKKSLEEFNRDLKYFNGDAALKEQEDRDNTFGARVKKNKSETEENPTPLGDNYVEVLNWKIKKLEAKEKEIQKVKFVLSVPNANKKENLKRKKILEKEAQKLENQIEYLKQNKNELLYHAVLEDLEEIKQAIQNDLIHNIDSVRQTLEFYTKFQNKLDSQDEVVRDIKAMITDLIATNEAVNYKETIKLLENNDNLIKTIENYNEEKGTEISVQDTLAALSDIDLVTAQTLGLSSSQTGDTVIPQFVLTEFMKLVNRKQNSVIAMIDKLREFNNLNPNLKNKNLIFEDDTTGQKLTGLYSSKWDAEISKRNKLEYSYRISTNPKEKAAAYRRVIEWHQKNTDVINFFKIKEIRDLYFGESAYNKYFIYEDSEMSNYEMELREKLGPLYEETLNTLKEKLANFEERKLDVDNTYFARNIAQNDIWSFLDKYLNSDFSPISFEYEGQERKVYFNSFYNVPFTAKEETVNPIGYDDVKNEVIYKTTKTNFYSDNFKSLKKDPKLLELWSIYREMGNYINTTYALQTNGKVTLPKVKQVFADHIQKNFESIRKGGIKDGIKNLFSESVQVMKSMYYEKGEYKPNPDGEVVSNYGDSVSKEIQNLKETYIAQGMSSEAALEKAKKQTLNLYSDDVDRNFTAVLLNAALHDAREEMAPKAKLLLATYSKIKDANGNDRVNGIQRLTAQINKIILNQSLDARGKPGKLHKEIKGKIKGVGIPKYFSEYEKLLLEQFKELKKGEYKGEFTLSNDEIYLSRVYDKKAKKFIHTLEKEGELKEVEESEFNAVYEKYIDDKIESLGIYANIAGMVTGALKTNIIKSMVLSPISGIYNRVEGVISLMIMDMTGEYWTPGNNDKSKDTMAFANIMNMSSKKYKTKKMGKRRETMEIFKQVVKKLGDFQDRKDVLQESAGNQDVGNNLMKFLYSWAIHAPEFKNQGQAMLNVMQDETILDNNGKEHQFFNGDSKEFAAFEIVNGIVKIKDNFNKSFSFESSQMENLMVKASDTISHVNGNYNQYDIMLLKNKLGGRALAAFKTWLPEQAYARFGGMTKTDENITLNLANQKEKRQGRFVEGYRGSKAATLAYGAGVVAISYGVLPGIVGASLVLGTSVGLAYVYKKYIKKLVNDKSTVEDIASLLHIAEFLKSTLIDSLNFPSRIASSIPGVKKLRINTIDNKIKFFNSMNGLVATEGNKSVYKSLTEEEAASLRAMSMELGAMLSVLLVKIGLGVLMYDDDDEEAIKQYNFVQNQLSKSINTLNFYTSPQAMFSDVQRIGLLKYLENMADVPLGIVDLDGERVMVGLGGITPIPTNLLKIDKNGMHVMKNSLKNDYLIDNFAGKYGSLNWTQDYIKDVATDSKFSEEKDYKEDRAEFRKQIKDEFRDITSSKAILSSIADAHSVNKYGQKRNGVVKFKSKSAIKNSLKRSLIKDFIELGMTNKEANEKMKEILDKTDETW